MGRVKGTLNHTPTREERLAAGVGAVTARVQAAHAATAEPRTRRGEVRDLVDDAPDQHVRRDELPAAEPALLRRLGRRRRALVEHLPVGAVLEGEPVAGGRLGRVAMRDLDGILALGLRPGVATAVDCG
jgi:hypothetical protein